MGWLVDIRDRDGAIVEACEDLTELTLAPKWCDVGTWALQVPLASPAAALLSRPGYGIRATLDDTPMFSGYVTSVAVDTGDALGHAVFAGVDDLIVLADRLASPQPGTASPPYVSSAYDTRSGVCETVLKAYVDANAGASAVPARRWAGLTVAPDLLRGSTVTGNARWHRLLDLAAELALAGGLGFRVVDLTFDVVAPVDRSAPGAVEFSVARGSLGRVQFAQQAPGGTYVIVGGGGEGTARTFLEQANGAALAAGWWRAERFRDARDTTDTLTMTQRAAEELGADADGSKLGLAIETIDTTGVRWPTDYALGDLVSVVTPFDSTVTRRVTGITITLSSENGTTITPTLGVLDPTRDETGLALSALQQQHRRITSLEVR